MTDLIAKSMLIILMIADLVFAVNILGYTLQEWRHKELKADRGKFSYNNNT
jgi:hypothetical protein